MINHDSFWKIESIAYFDNKMFSVKLVSKACVWDKLPPQIFLKSKEYLNFPTLLLLVET